MLNGIRKEKGPKTLFDHELDQCIFYVHEMYLKILSIRII